MDRMFDAASIVLFTGRILFLLDNIILTYIFLSPKRKLPIQITAYVSTWVALLILRILIEPLIPDPLLRSYILGSVFLIPISIIFKETLQTKVFVFYMIFSLSQFTFLIFTYIDHYLAPSVSGIFVLSGLIAELALLPLVRRYLKDPVREIVNMIGRQNHLFMLFPFLSFLLLVNIAIKRSYSPADFISLVLYTLLIFFSYYLISVAITESKRRAELDLISRTDSLTGLFNRRHMEQKIAQEWDRFLRTGSVFAIVIADVDYFKNVNDKFGHDRGDQILKSIAADIRNSVRTYDVVGRWGGEEFLILLPSIDVKNAEDSAERIRRTVESHSYEGADLSVTLTLGFTVSIQSISIDEMIKHADSALYHGKRQSRNCVVCYEKISNSQG